MIKLSKQAKIKNQVYMLSVDIVFVFVFCFDF